MKTNNLPYLILIGIGLLIAFGGFLMSNFSDNPEAESWISIGLWLSELIGFFMLFLNGTFIKTKYFRIVKGFISILFVGVIFKIMHYGYSDYLLIGGFVGIILTYLFSFLKKPIKKRLDYFKLAWVITAYSYNILSYLHYIGEEYKILSSALMWLMIIDYMKTQKEKGFLF